MTFKIKGVSFKTFTFVYAKGNDRPRWYTVRLWAWLYNLCNIIIDFFALQEGQVMMRVPMAKRAVDYSVGYVHPDGSPVKKEKDIDELKSLLDKKGFITKKTSDNEIKIYVKDK